MTSGCQLLGIRSTFHSSPPQNFLRICQWWLCKECLLDELNFHSLEQNVSSLWDRSSGIFSDSQDRKGCGEVTSSISASRQAQQSWTRRMSVVLLAKEGEGAEVDPWRSLAGNPPYYPSSSPCAGHYCYSSTLAGFYYYRIN